MYLNHVNYHNFVIFSFRTSKQAVEEQRKQESQYSGDVDVVRNRVQEIQNELENVIEQLGEAKVYIWTKCCVIYH